MILGECNCGTVRAEIREEPDGLYVCHCSICRRSSGANGNVVAVVEKSNFRWVTGEDFISNWTKPGHDWQSSFCKQCGSQLPGENDEARMYVPAGFFSEGGENLKVIHHIWVDSKAGWDEIGDEGMLHPCELGSGETK